MFRSFRALNHKAFLLVWIGSLLSNIGNWMENVGQGWVIASQTHSAFQVELLSFAQFFSVIFLAIPAGIIADRYNRKNIILTSQVFMCLFAAILAVLAHKGMASPVLIILITFLEGSAWALNGPAWQSVIPHLVPRKDLESAIALTSIQYNLARLLGPAIAGYVVAHFGFAYAFDINALSFVAVIIAIAFTKMSPTQSAKETGTFSNTETPLTDIALFKQAWHWVWTHKGAKRIIISITCFAILSAPLQGLMPFFASDILQIGPKGLGALLACLGAGAVSGAFLVGMLPEYYPRHHLIPISMWFLGIFMFIYSQTTSVHISYLILFCAGIFWLWTMISCNTALQLLVPDKMRGRVMSILIVAHVGMLPFGHLIGGLLATWIGPRSTIMIVSILMSIAGLLSLIRRVPEIDGYPSKGRKVKFKNFFSEVILATGHRAEALSLDRTSETQKIKA